MDTKYNPVIDNFVKTWQERTFVYDALAFEVRKRCEDGLGDIKCIFSHRAKSLASLQGSILRQQSDYGKEFTHDVEIVETMTDLAGVRLALYFPDDLARVERFLHGAFVHARPPVVWGDGVGEFAAKENGERLVGYRGTHYRVRLKPDSRVPQVLLNRTVEIQVTSVLMHAWADVYHDLIYKPYADEITREEGRILDLINGLAQASEVALQQLQTSLQRKIAQKNRKFVDQYELGVWLKDQASHYFGTDIAQQCRMEHLNILLDVLRVWHLDVPDSLRSVLRTSMPTRSMINQPEIRFENVSKEKSKVDRFGKFIDLTTMRAEDIIQEMESSVNPDEVDLSVWALLRACHSVADPIQHDVIGENRVEAFTMVNSLNMALSMSDSLPFKLKPFLTNDSLTYISYLWGHPETSSIETHTNDLWWGIKPFRRGTKGDDYRLWILSCFLSVRGITVLPESLSPNQAFLWPGILGWPSRRIAVQYGNMQQATNLAIKKPLLRRRHYSDTSSRDTLVNDRPCFEAQKLLFLRTSTEQWKALQRRPMRPNQAWRYSSISLDEIASGSLWKELLRPSTPRGFSSPTPGAEFPTSEGSLEYIKDLEGKLAFITGLLVEAEKEANEAKLQVQRF